MSFRYGLVLSLYVATVVGCVHQRSRHGGDKTEVPWEQSRHWIHNDALREVMTRLIDQTPPGVAPGDRDANERLWADAATYARSLSEAASRIPSAVANEHLSEADRAAFNAQVATLREQSASLAAAADEQDADAMGKLLKGIDATCTSCHTRFRDYSGLLDHRREASGRRHDARHGTGSRPRTALAGDSAVG